MSTWRRQPLADLDFDCLIENDDPGPLNIRDGERVVAKENTNRQIVSTLSGLRRVETPYAVKFRSDNILLTRSFIRLQRLSPCAEPPGGILQERVVLSSINTIDPRSFLGYVFQFSDWFFYGRTQDLLRIWDRPLIPDDPFLLDEALLEERRFRNGFHFGRFSAEQHISLGFIRKYMPVRCSHYRDHTNGNVALTESILADNFVVAEPSRIGFHFPKYASLCRLDLRSFTSLKQYLGFHSTTMGFRRWSRLLGNACGASRGTSLRTWDVRLLSMLLYAKSYSRSAR